jgi:hypothetical protein
MTALAPGAAVVVRDARTLPLCERRDGRPSGHAIYITNFAEEPEDHDDADRGEAHEQRRAGPVRALSA